MLITQTLKFRHILKTTWKLDILVIFMCSGSYYLHEVVIKDPVELPLALATLLGTAIAFFVGFNNNQAYDRWWEARTIWGELVNDSRSWSRTVLHNITTNTDKDDLKDVKRQMVCRQLAFVYALKESLRDKKEGYYKKFLSKEEVLLVEAETNIPNAILSLNANSLQQLSDAALIDGFRFMQFSQFLNSFTDQMGKCERIKNTVFPTTYIFYTKLFIFILTVFITLILSTSLGGYSILIGWIFGFIFHITHQNGMFLMNPFEEIATGIPLNQIARTIEINLLEMVGEKDIPAPELPIDDQYYL